MNNVHHKFYGLERDVLRRILLLESVELGEIANSMNSSGLESSPAYYTCLEDMVDDAEKSLADTSVVPINDLTLIRSLEESIHTSRDSSSALLLLKAENVKNLLQQRHNQWIALLQKLNCDPEDVKKKLIESSSISHDDVDPHSLAKSHDPIADTNSMEKSRDQALNTLQASNSGGTTSAIVMNQMQDLVADAEKSLADTSVVPLHDLAHNRALEEAIIEFRNTSSLASLSKAENLRSLLLERHNQWIALLKKLNFDPEDVKKKLVESSSIVDTHDDVDPPSGNKSRDQPINTLQASNSGGTTSANIMTQMRENFQMKLLVELINENKV
uniref:Uncharacterized protein n=1 Tax=Panagrolaimus sp. ES5 TaxID=591445 RepID=A0AC34FY74_9BILA